MIPLRVLGILNLGRRLLLHPETRGRLLILTAAPSRKISNTNAKQTKAWVQVQEKSKFKSNKALALRNVVGQARDSNEFAALRDVDEDGGEDELAAGIGNEVAKRHLRKFQEEQVATMIPEGNEQLPSHSLASVPHDATPVLIAEDLSHRETERQVPQSAKKIIADGELSPGTHEDDRLSGYLEKNPVLGLEANHVSESNADNSKLSPEGPSNPQSNSNSITDTAVEKGQATLMMADSSVKTTGIKSAEQGACVQLLLNPILHCKR